MRKIFFVLFIQCIFTIQSHSQVKLTCADFSYLPATIHPQLGIVIYSDDEETVWNALRLANFSRSKGDTVMIFLLGKGIDGYQKDSPRFNIAEQAKAFVASGGQVLACASCVKLRGQEEVNTCTVSSLADLYEIIKRSEKVLCF